MDPVEKNDPYRELKSNSFLKFFATLFDLGGLLFQFVFSLIFLVASTAGYYFLAWLKLQKAWGDQSIPSDENPYIPIILVSLFLLPFFLAGLFLFISTVKNFVGLMNLPTDAEKRRQQALAERSGDKKVKLAIEENSNSVKEGKGATVKNFSFNRTVKPDGTVEYTSQSAYGVAAVFVAFFALFWNGIVIGGILDLSSSANPLGYLFILLLAPFIVVGIALIGAFVYCILMMRFPTFRLQINPSAVKRGQEAVVNWSFDRVPKGIRNLSIWIEASYVEIDHSGESTTRTRTSVFKQFILERGEARGASVGVPIVLPESIGPSAETNDEAIEWTIRVRGQALGPLGYNLVFPIPVE